MTLAHALAALKPAFAGLFGGLFAAASPAAPDASRLTPDALVLVKGVAALPAHTEVAAFAAGCFWGVEDAFRKEPGVVATAVGFMGGHTHGPTYEEVCTHTTGHAETVELRFDPSVVSYAQLVRFFFDIHDPTTVDRQGPDVGDQYRSAVFTFSDQQRATAQAERDKLQQSGELSAPIATEITPASAFTKAEEYHQQYVEKGGYASCHVRRHAAK